MIDQLKDLKDTFESARTQIDRGREPLEDLIKIQNFLQAVHEDPAAFIDKADKDYKKYFFDDFTMGLLKRLARERSRDDKYLDVVKDILKSYMLIFIDFLKIGLYNQQFFDGIKFLFEYDSILHNFNYQIPEEELKRLRSANQEWRKHLKIGDMVDAIADENNVRCSGWSQARISSVNTDVLQLEFIYDTKAVDRYLDRWSVEIAPYESKTKELWEWKSTIAVGTLVDANDKSTWNKSTILDIKDQQIAPDRVVKMGFIGYRVYVETGNKYDDKGNFEGWSSKFDEWIAIYSPRIQQFHSKTQKGVQDDLDLDEDLDALLQAEEGFNRVYAVPRIRKCTSSVFLHLINLFGNSGGFDLILNILSKSESASEQEANEDGNNNSNNINGGETLNLNMISSIIQCISYPFLVYHKDFLQEYGQKLIDQSVKALKNAPEKSLRDVRREKIEGIIKSIDNFYRRLSPKDEREKQTEMLKLEVALMCLKSSFLERRIQGIRDLNQIIKNLRMFSVGNKAFTNQILIEWMQNNGVFSILFDTKKTHLQLVQRCTDIVKLLLSENMFTPQLMEMFWSLAKTDYKFEIYKIINDCSFYFKQEHIDFFFEQIKQVPAEKLAIEEFQCLSELGKYAKDDQFRLNVSGFFWNIICNSDNVKEDLVNSCINKFCEMVKSWDLSRKYNFFEELIKNLSENKSSISSIRLFKGLIKDQKEKSNYSYNNSPQRYDSSVPQDQNLISQEPTIAQCLNKLIQEGSLTKVLLDNLKYYCQLARAKSNQQTKNENRKKLYLVNPKYSHHEEIDERLQFLKYVASVASEYQISKVELGIIYDLLSNDENIIVSSDPEEFLTWCKSSCEQSSSISQILDLNEVGQFFTEKMNSGELDVKNLIVVGFDFLQQYFLSLNENQQKIMKVQPKQTKQKYNNYGGYTSITYGYNSAGQYGPKNIYQANGKKQEEEESQQNFKLIINPAELDQLDIVWNMALQCQNSKVVPKAIDFLIKVYYNLDSDLEIEKTEIQEHLIEKCIKILKESQDEQKIIRVIEIIKNIIFETEKKGTSDVKPHNALLKGELLENVTIKNKTSPKTKNIIMRIYSNATVWEFKKEVAKQLDLAPKYLKLELAANGGQVIKDIENGKTLAQLGLQSNDVINAFKIQVEEEVPNAPLIGPDQKLTEKAKQIFNEWFDLYSDENKQMTKETCSLFIKGCTGEQPQPNDDRIINLFKQYDRNQDEKIEREEFLQFYETASRSKPDTVRENLRSHNIRNDLKKLSEITEESSYRTEEMPRFKISKNQEQFDLLIQILDRQDGASQASWDLIQMLSTNQELYKRVLSLSTALDVSTDQIDWSKFFDNQSVYKLLYTLQIVEAVMEEGEGEGLESVTIVNDDDANKKKNIPNAPPMIGPVPLIQVQSQDEPKTEVEQPDNQHQAPTLTQIKRTSTIVEDEQEDRKLRSQWTSMFLKHNGFQYILQVFMSKEIQSSQNKSTNQQFELKHIAFLLKLLRIFIMAAFSTSSESQIYDSISLIRKSSNVDEQHDLINNASLDNNENSRFKELQKLMEGPIGEKIIQEIDYKVLQQKILNLIQQILVHGKDLNQRSMTFEDKLIIENALSLWVGCVMHKNELLNDFYEFQSDEFILQGLLYCEQEKVREEFKLSLSQLAQKLLRADGIKEIPLVYLLRLLSEKFSLISQYHCKQYFELFCELIDHYFNLKNQGQGNAIQQEVFNPENLLGLIIDKIKDYNQLNGQLAANSNAIANGNEQDQDSSPSNSSNPQVSEQEEIYIGLIQLTGKIIDNFDISFSEKIVEQKNLIDEIFVQFLFASVFKQDGKSALDNLKIRPKQNSRSQSGKKATFGKRSKDAAYKLLNSLIRKSPFLMNSFLEKSMVPLMKLIRKQDGWNYSPPDSSEKSQKYVGLRNLGCICYMNSMLQQFFMIPAFRYNLLCVDDKVPLDLQEYKGLKIDDNVLHQLQKLMAHLELSERTEYNPVEFCFAFKDLDGNPTNTGEQKDAQEFLNLSFDRIENLLRGTTRKYLLQSVFGGQTCNQFVCLECGKVKNRIEDFYNLSLTVKDIKSLYDSLQKQIEGEVINDYECDQCKKKVDISKRMLISQAPNVLIVHLQRITFNFETFRNDKINSFFEFPFQLDLKPYSFYEVMKKENRLKQKGGEDNEEGEAEQQQVQDEDNQWPEEENCFEYKLVGVNVHSGTANAGHYWSFINTRRGVSEPDENDPNWSKTESDPWMKFNDSQVTEYNVEKLKDDCYGGDGKSGGDGDSWSFGGSYGQSAYMLVYEKRQKRPIKILATPEEVSENKEKLLYDSKKEEYYKLIDYREGVEDIAPNDIYKQVFEDNFKFEFENDIYSSEFFEFVRQIIIAVFGLDKDRKHQGNSDLENAKKNMLTVSKKVILEILAKCFLNTSIKHLVESLIDVMNKDPSLCSQFLDQCFREDNCNYLFEILLECTDTTSRIHVANLVKFIINKLKIEEKDRLYDIETVEIQTPTGVVSQEQHVALSSRFVMKALNLLNTQVAKSWSRFDNFLEILYSFALGSIADIPSLKSQQSQTEQDQPNPDDQIGLEFLFRNNFFERACDFILGKKSPLVQPGEKRFEMGGSYSSPNFSAVTKLITKMLTHTEFTQKYPLSDLGRKMFLHQDLLKVMLGAQANAKQFGQCLASMCVNNLQLSRKVSKVFIKAINGSSPDTLKAYLKALKPFLRVDDEFKQLKLEWIFGFSQINNRKTYNSDKYKYGLEFVDRINEEAHTYMTPLSSGPNDDSLFSQLLKCKGKQDTNCILCLQEMLHLMSKDDDIAKFVYNTAPPTYQYSRYTDWFRIYLETQRGETERQASYNAFFKNKFESIIKSLVYLEKFEEKCKQFQIDERNAYERAKEEEGKDFAEVENDWLAYKNSDVIEHFPPQYIIGRQVAEEREFLVNDEDPNVKVTIYEIACEYNYSNPTRYFNISLPHIEAKTSMYQTMSYIQFKRLQLEELKKRQIEEAKQQDSESTDAQSDSEKVNIDPQEQRQEPFSEDNIVNLDDIQVINWFNNRKESPPVLLKILVSNKQRKKVSVKITLSGDSNGNAPNAHLPKSELKELFFDSDTRCLVHLEKIDPRKPWGDIKVQVQSKVDENSVINSSSSYGRGQQAAPSINISSIGVSVGSYGGNSQAYVSCWNCKKLNDYGMDYCEKCGESLNERVGTSIMDNYFHGIDSDTNFMS